jgi:hypothetical protein
MMLDTLFCFINQIIPSTKCDNLAQSKYLMGKYINELVSEWMIIALSFPQVIRI